MKSTLPLAPVFSLFGCCLLAFWSGGCAAPGGKTEEPLFFASPEAAVEIATPLLRANDWPTLARYYDLAGSPVAREELVNGTFFFSERIEGMQHPAGLSRYKHPFAPGFRFLRSEAGPLPETTKVTVQIEIDQGAGAPAQRGLSAFLLRRSPRGHQFLPTKIDP
jgi:hypothetical protein